jgi:type 2 lantibiotic biosynthesis protein LanM
MSSSGEQTAVAPAAASAGFVAAWDPAFELFSQRDWAAVRERWPAQLCDVDLDAVARCVTAEERAVLRGLCGRTLVLELNCARLRGQLAGATPEERFADFVAGFRDSSGWARLFEEYGVLREAVQIARHHFRDQVIELLERLAADGAELAARGLPGGPGARLVGLAASLSDPHRGGRGVWKLTFELGGAEVRLMYKPKSLAVDACFQQLLGRCNEAIDRGELSGVPRFRIMRVVDRGGHGWVEHLAPAPCEDGAAVDRFYRRQGATLALLHVLLGTDVHYENLIAHGEHPVVVDLETLFHPFLVPHEPDPPARRAAEARLERSVLRVGLLPWRAFRGQGKAGVNVGALGDGEAHELPFLVPGWEDAGRDDMRLVEKQVALPMADNLPRVGDQVVPFTAHMEAIAGGFEAMARHLARERGAWLASGGVLDQFAGHPVRYVLRATRTYARVLQATAHPDHLRRADSAAQARAVLDELADSMARSPAVRVAEEADLADRDIPYFGGRPDSAHVWDSRGRCIPDLLPVSGLAAAREQLTALDESEVERQVWYTRAALAAAAFHHATPEIGPVRTVGPGEPGHPLAERAVSLAAAIGGRLADRAVPGRDGATWIGLVDSGSEAFTVGPVGADLYDGVAGIALFLATLGCATREDRFLVLAERAARLVESTLLAGETRPQLGGFVGIPSQLYALAHVEALAGCTGIGAALEPSLDRLTSSLAGSRDADVIYGAAGAILALLGVYQVTRREALLPALLASLDVIERTACPQAEGVAWPDPGCDRPLLGFAHGNAGIASALAHLGRLLEDAGHAAANRCAMLAASARRHERARFDPGRGNWPDFRAPEPEGRSLVAWCHGAPGVVLSRLAGREALVDADSLAELEIGVATTLEHDRGRHTLCHGDVGNLAIVAHLADRLGRTDWRQRVNSRLPGLLDGISARPRLDSAFADAAPGLMTGLAGAGYGLLAIARPELVPLVLALEPPRKAGDAPAHW